MVFATLHGTFTQSLIDLHCDVGCFAVDDRCCNTRVCGFDEKTCMCSVLQSRKAMKGTSTMFMPAKFGPLAVNST